MKQVRRLRVLTLFAFLLLIAPFYDHCNGHRMKKAEEATEEVAIDTTIVETDSVIIDSNEINKVAVDTVTNSVEVIEIPIYVKIYEFIDDNNSENAFEMASLIENYFDTPFKEFIKNSKSGISKNDYRGLFFGLKNLCFLLIVINTFLMFILSFTKIVVLHKLSKLNLILLSITVICLFLEGLFETISQIKWGYYAFIITNLLILYYSNPKFQSQKHQIINRNS